MTRKMKDSGIEWIGEIPENWNSIQMKYLVNITTGNKDTVDAEPNGIYPFFIRSETPKKINTYSFDGEGILTAGDGNVGEIFHYIKGKFDFHQRVYLIYDFKNINIKYLYLYLQANLKKHISYFSAKTTVESLRLPWLKCFPVIYPSIEEQDKIIDFIHPRISKIEKLINETQQSIEELKKYKQSLITEAVTKGLDPNVEMKDSGIEWIGKIPKHWLITRPNRITTNVRGNSGFQKVDMKNTGDYVAVQYGQVYKLNVLDEKYQLYVDGKFYKEDQVVQKGDTILVSTSETMEDLGHSCFYNRKDIGLLGGEQLCLKPNKKVLFDKFLYYATTYFNLELNQYATGLKVYRFKLDDLKKINMIVPSTIEEQRQIVSYLDEQTSRIDKLIADKTKVIEELEDYKKSLIYEYVTGKKEV